ncbi:MAG: exosortase [Oxalobacteraceae bacterium]|nr:MAG: exosortase [Oxalobacteraceae bacterium]
MKQSAVSEREQPGIMASLAGQRALLPALVVGLVLLCLLFLPEGRAAVEVWNASTAYSHCYLILPMTLYLLRERWAVVRAVGANPEPFLALAAIPIAMAWLVAERLGFMEGRQLAAIASVELFLCAILGRRLFWQLSGPLLFLFFLVPFGAFLTPVLQRFTAAFSIIGLNVLGIPNFSDNFTIETPSGVFFVAEACAGLRFLIAAIAFGVFYALLNYTSPTRRACFMAASIVIPILANGIRALGIIVLGQILGSAEAAAADHIIYGWVFFTIVMLLLIAGGQLFREPTATVYQPTQAAASGTKRSALVAALFSVALLSLGPAAASLIDARVVAPEFSEAFPFAAPIGCVVTGKSGPTSHSATTMSCGGTPFELRVNLFAPRSTSSAMVAERRRVTQEISAEDVAIASADVPDSVGRWTIVQTTDPDRLTAYASWVDGAPVRSGTAGRIAQARDSLFGGDHAAALITITSVEPDKSSPVQRKAVRQRLIDVVNGQTGLADKMSEYTKLASH